LLHQFKFFGVQRTGLFQDTIVDANFSYIMQKRRDTQLVEFFLRESKFACNESGIFRYSAGMASRVGVLFVDGRRQHANGAEEQFTICFGGFLQFFNVLFDVAGHLIEIFGELADFGSATNRGALMKLAAADGSGGSGQTVNWLADGYRE